MVQTHISAISQKQDYPPSPKETPWLWNSCGLFPTLSGFCRLCQRASYGSLQIPPINGSRSLSGAGEVEPRALCSSWTLMSTWQICQTHSCDNFADSPFHLETVGLFCFDHQIDKMKVDFWDEGEAVGDPRNTSVEMKAARHWSILETFTWPNRSSVRPSPGEGHVFLLSYLSGWWRWTAMNALIDSASYVHSFLQGQHRNICIPSEMGSPWQCLSIHAYSFWPDMLAFLCACLQLLFTNCTVGKAPQSWSWSRLRVANCSKKPNYDPHCKCTENSWRRSICHLTQTLPYSE